MVGGRSEKYGEVGKDTPPTLFDGWKLRNFFCIYKTNMAYGWVKIVRYNRKNTDGSQTPM